MNSSLVQGLKVTQDGASAQEAFTKTAKSAVDNGDGLEPHAMALRAKLGEWLATSKWTLEANRMDAEGACLSAMPTADPDKGPADKAAWAKEIDDEVMFGIQRTIRKEISVAQQRVEEAFFEGRLKAVLKKSEEATALAGNKRLLYKTIKESTSAAKNLAAKGMLPEQAEELSKVRKAQVKLNNAENAMALVVRMEQRMQMMQHYRTSQELLEDGSGPLHTRLVQLENMLCESKTPTARRVIRGSIRFLNRQLKRIQRQLHWGLKREEQQSFIKAEALDMETRANQAKKIVNLADKVGPALDELYKKTQCESKGGRTIHFPGCAGHASPACEAEHS
jgi:DNA-binding transcriptional regulator GbsR (MarR family)